MIFVRNFVKALLRRKQIDSSHLSDTNLDRCLSTLDLTALGECNRPPVAILISLCFAFSGIGSTLGLGIYVLAGEVASRTSGPAVTISFLIGKSL